MKKTLVIAKADIAKKSIEENEDLSIAMGFANGNSRSFTYDSWDVIGLARKAEARLDRAGLPQALRVGFEMTATHAGPAAKSYGYTANGSQVTLRRTARGWVLVEAGITGVYPAADEKIEYRATVQQIEEISRRAVADLKRFPEEQSVAA
ncbi:hypothetical protein [Pelagibacterium mangrovi]|uniref:hypothetical protein n=1 Tax=Pelagibacterium mangrovi TaxID=3119828 RepID=UPI002FC610C6